MSPNPQISPLVLAQHPPYLANGTESEHTSPLPTLPSANSTSNSNQNLSRQGSPHPAVSTELPTQSDSEINSPANSRLIVETIATSARNNSPAQATAVKVVSVYTSAEHNIQPSGTVDADDVIPTFSLSRETDVDGSLARSESYEGSDL